MGRMVELRENPTIPAYCCTLSPVESQYCSSARLYCRRPNRTKIQRTGPCVQNMQRRIVCIAYAQKYYVAGVIAPS